MQREQLSMKEMGKFTLMDMKERTLFSDKVRLVYLQLPYFTKEAEECETIFEKIIYTLKHMDILQRMPWMAQNAVFKRLSEIAEVASLNSEERRKYDESLRAYRDTLAVMDGQFVQGEQKGRAEEKLANARSLKENGVPADIIAKSLGLTAEEIERL